MDIYKEALNKFGELLMHRVRDYSIGISTSIVNVKSNDPAYDKISECMNEECKEALRYFIPIVVDEVMHSFLCMLEETDWIDISVETEQGRVPTIRGIGDGLHGDLFSWIPEYSKERQDYLQDYFGDLE